MLKKIIQRLANNRGSSLLECIISLAFFGVITTMAAFMLGTATTITRRSTDLENAVNQVGDQAELATTATDVKAVHLVFKTDGGVQAGAAQAEMFRLQDDDKLVTLWKFAPLPQPPAGS